MIVLHCWGVLLVGAAHAAVAPVAAREPCQTYALFATAKTTVTLPGYKSGAVFYRARDGRWVRRQARVREGTATLAMDPGAWSAGATQVVVNKPPWVRLDDSQPPRVMWVRCGGKRIELTKGKAELPTLAPGETIELRVEDDVNRISLRRTHVSLNGSTIDSPGAARVQRDPANPKRATIRVKLPADLRFGEQALRFHVCDESPASPATEVTLTGRRFGVDLAPDGNHVSFHTRQASYTCWGNPRGLFTADVLGLPAGRLAVEGKGEFQHTEAFREPPRLLVDEPGRKVVSVRPSLWFDKPRRAANQFDLELRCEIRADRPGILVTTRLTALQDLPGSYLFWSDFLSGPEYVASDGSHGTWHTGYADIEPQGWIWLSPTETGKPGAGVISDGELSEYLGNSLLIFTKPKRRKHVRKGEATTVTWYYFPATDAAEVGAEVKAVESLLPSAHK